MNERPYRAKGQANNKVLFSQSAEGKTIKCPLCSAAHKIHGCDTFKKMSIVDRRNTVSKLRLCFNCLNYGHQVRDCKLSSCPQCGKRHNSKLHTASNTESSSQNRNSPVPGEEQAVLYTEVATSSKIESPMNAMLATAIIHVNDKNGQPRPCRAVLDSGSQLNFVTDACADELGLRSSKFSCNIVGVGDMCSKSKLLFKTIVSSRFGENQRSVQFHSLSIIVSSVPSQMVNGLMNILHHIRSRLADPQFCVPGSVDILIGTKVFFEILGNEKWQLSAGASLRNTDFGWIVTGELPFMSSTPSSLLPVLSDNSSLSLFTSKASHQSIEELRAEEYFNTTVSRNEQGRFVVRLPLTQDPKVLGDSRNSAQKRFFNLEK